MLKKGTVIQSNGSNYIVSCDNQHYDCVIKGKLRQKGYNSTNPVAVGDFVEFDISKDPATITQIFERRNCIIRKSTNLSKQSHIIAANIDQAVFVFTMRQPETTTVFLDRFLVSAESYSIPTIIIFNKIDIYKPEEFDQVAELMATYAEIGYKVLDVSVTKNHNLDAVREILKDKVSLISGQSGVGKTSIVNAVSGQNLKTASISESHESGKHTTSFAQMLPLDFGGYIIDTPGVRAFGLVELERNCISHYFPEIFKTAEKCRFYNCTHTNEPGCAVKEAVENGEIAWSRYHSYTNIYFDEDEKHRREDY